MAISESVPDDGSDLAGLFETVRSLEPGDAFRYNEIQTEVESVSLMALYGSQYGYRVEFSNAVELVIKWHPDYGVTVCYAVPTDIPWNTPTSDRVRIIQYTPPEDLSIDSESDESDSGGSSSDVGSDSGPESVAEESSPEGDESRSDGVGQVGLDSF